jgi:Uma2 family endonuclease
MTLQLLDKTTIATTPGTCLTLYGVSWEQFEAIDAVLADFSEIRLTYLDGILDIMSPLSDEHEDTKSTISLLVEAYFRYRSLRFYMRGSPTLGSKALGTRSEPDNSYNLETKKDIPDLVLEVVITSGGVDKLEKYRRIGVPEVWFWRKGQLYLYHLRPDGYEAIAQSELLPDLDISLLVLHANMEDQYDAVKEFTQAIAKT